VIVAAPDASGPTTRPDIAATAVALHHATRRLRARFPGLPMLWAPLTRTGIWHQGPTWTNEAHAQGAA
jgi:hypothetical protein